MSAANRYTTSELLDDIRRDGHVPPASQSDFGDSDLLAIADTETWAPIMEQILSVRENYYLTYTDTAVNATGLYEIPVRALGGKLDFIQILMGTTLYPVVRSEIGSQLATNQSPSGAYSFYLKGNYVQILPVPSSGSVRLWHFVRPNKLVAATSAARISAINSSVITVESIPSTFTTAMAMDFIKDQPGFDWLATDYTPSVISTLDLTFSSVPSSLAVGDWIALAGQTPVPQIPVEFRTLLSLRTAERIAIAQGYSDKFAMLANRRKEIEKSLFTLINPRVEEQPKQIVPDGSFLGGAFGRAQWRAT